MDAVGWSMLFIGLIRMFVFDGLQIQSGRIQICSVLTASNCTLLAMGPIVIPVTRIHIHLTHIPDCMIKADAFLLLLEVTALHFLFVIPCNVYQNC